MNSKILSRALLTLMMSLSLGASNALEEITYYHNDALGSPVAATDEAGNLKWREEYQPYGERLLKEDNDTNDTWFTGKQEDKSNGLSYFGARWYEPVLGRFTGIDPVDFQEKNIHSFNRYAYANNNPYKYVDPDGMMGELIDAIGDDGSGFTGAHSTSDKSYTSDQLGAAATVAALPFAGPEMILAKGIGYMKGMIHLSRLNSVDDVVKRMTDVTKLKKGGFLQGRLKGIDGKKLFKKLAKKYGVKLKKGQTRFSTEDGTNIGYHKSHGTVKSDGSITLDINTGKSKYKVRTGK